MPGRRKIRWVVFTEDMPGKVPAILVDALLEEIARRPQMELAAVCLRQRKTEEGNRPPKLGLLRRLKGLFRKARELNLMERVQGSGAPVIVAPDSNINDPSLVAQLREMGVTHGFSIYCIQKFGAELLDSFEAVANYHNGLLPHYKGIRATSWSIYQGEPHTGYTYHLMNRHLDDGPVLLAGSIPIPPEGQAVSLDKEKARHAAGNIGRVLDLIASGASGTPQEGPGRYFSRSHLEAIRHLGDPALHDSTEILKRLRAFNSLNITLDGTIRELRKLRLTDTPGEHPAFRCKDGVWLEIVK